VSGGQIAALIAAGFFAVGMCAAVFVLFRLAGLISHANRILADYSDRAGTLIERAQAAVDRTNEQLARTDSITASMDEVTANMADLSGHVSALAGLARGISAGFGTPLLRISAFFFGVHRAVALRRPARVVPAARPEPGLRPPQKGAVPAGPDALHRGHSARPRRALPAQRAGAPGGSHREEARH
jgi:hypothetical protein